MKNLFPIIPLILISAFAHWANAEITTLSVFPERVELRSARSRMQLVVTGIDQEGNAVDLTREATYRPHDSAVQVASHGIVTTNGDGHF